MTVVNELRSGGAVNTLTRVVLLGALALAALWSLVNVVGAVVGIVSGVLQNEVVATLTTRTPAAVGRSGGPLTSAVYDSASVVVTGAPGGVQCLVVIAESAAVVTRLTLGIAFVLLIVAVLRRAPFSARTALQIILCGGIAMITALLGVGAGAFADWMIADFLTTSGAGRWPIAAAVDLSLVPLGFGLMVVGLLISHGTRLQRATDGLV